MEMNNKYWSNGCPGLMEDSRFTTNYYNNTMFNQQIRHLNKVDNNHQYRALLQKNATKILDKERQFFIKNYTCNFNSTGGNSCRNPKTLSHN
jgi:hypothetical protein